MRDHLFILPVTLLWSCRLSAPAQASLSFSVLFFFLAVGYFLLGSGDQVFLVTNCVLRFLSQES